VSPARWRMTGVTSPRGSVAGPLLTRLQLTGQALWLAVPSAVASVALFAASVASASLIVVWVGILLTLLVITGVRRRPKISRTTPGRNQPHRGVRGPRPREIMTTDPMSLR
jgi:hypothetical protein